MKGKGFRKPIDKMTDDELYGTIRWAGDLIGRMISDLEGFRRYLQEIVNAGREGLDVETCKNTLYLVSEKALAIHKKAWYALFCMAKLYKIKVILEGERKYGKK